MAAIQLDETLRKALAYLLQSIHERNELMDDLLLIEVDWADEVLPLQTEPAYFDFQGRRWPFIFTDSELVLRRLLCQNHNSSIIVAVPSRFNLRELRDLLARSHGGAIQRLGLRHQLYALTEREWPVEIDDLEWRTSIQRHRDMLVADVGALNLTNRTLTREQLERSLVKAAYGLTVAEYKDSQILAALVSAQRKSFEPPSRLETALLQGQLNQAHIKWSSILLWTAAEAGRADRLIRTGIMIAAERQARRMPNWGSLNAVRAIFINQYQLAEEEAQNSISTLAIDALNELRPNVARRIAREAERELLDILPNDAYNQWFPTMLIRACTEVAERLARRDQGITTRIVVLKEHLFAKPEHNRLSALGEMAALVTMWSYQEESVKKLASTSDWATWYAHYGADLDSSALRLKQYVEQGIDLKESLKELLDRYWRWRSNLNHTFAETWLAHYEEAIHDRSSQVFGIHRILQWVVQPLRQNGKRVLLVVMDGMGYVAFRNLVQNWSEQEPPVYADEAQIGLSLLPSITSVARKGLFLGKLPTDHLDDEDAYNEKAKINELNALKQAFPHEKVALYHKGILGQLTTDFAAPTADIIAVIFNHIDDDLSNKNHDVHFPTLKEMGPLVQVVDNALRTGWAVVMTSDHGHTWHRGTELRQSNILKEGGERYFPITKPGQFIPPEAVVTRDPNIVATHESKSIALLTANGAYFGSQPRRGYHGGASLEEVVVPCATLSHNMPTYSTPRISPSISSRIDTPIIHNEEQKRNIASEVEGIILKLEDGRTIDLILPITLSGQEARLLQILAQLGEVSEDELRKALNSRRVAGIIARLCEQLAQIGPNYDYVEQTGSGAEGAIYRFRKELIR
jgi:hypothetical protein